MLKEYTNALLDAVTELGFDATLFYLDKQPARQELLKQDPPPNLDLGWSSRLKNWIAGTEGLISGTALARPAEPILTIGLENSAMRFQIREKDNSFDVFDFRFTFFHPGFPLFSWSEGKKWPTVRSGFIGWLNYDVRRYLEEMESPDKWAQMDAYKPFSNDSPPPRRGEESIGFSEEEKEQVHQSINNFRGMIAEEFDPSPEQSKFIDERLEYLSKATERLNRFDWNGLAISIVVNIAVNLSVDTERGRVLFTLFKSAFQATTKLLN
jgi:hypothetical protein